MLLGPDAAEGHVRGLCWCLWSVSPQGAIKTMCGGIRGPCCAGSTFDGPGKAGTATPWTLQQENWP